MDISVKSGHPDQTTADCIVVGIFESHNLSPAAKFIDEMTGKMLSSSLKSGSAIGKLGQTTVASHPNLRPGQRILTAGCGKHKEFNAANFNKVLDSVARGLRDNGCKQAAIFLTELAVADKEIGWVFKHAGETLENALYQFDQLKSKSDRKNIPLKKIWLFVAENANLKLANLGLRQGKAIAKGTKLAKDLGNLPGNVCTPTYLANQAKKLRKSHNIKVTIHNQQQMEKLGMHALLSVARGSREAPKLITMEYRGTTAKSATIVLVGKGLTFDAGGISLKPAAAMDEMKYDMCGGASVIGAVVAAAELKLPIHLVAIVPSSENLPDGAANKPGDIVKSMSGQTIEILNTDAEGRLILCDALSYAEKFKPAAIVDVATLTGACVVALGSQASGLFANDDALADELLAAGEQSQDRAWRLPIWSDYQQQLKSNFADVANIGGRYAGAITAACFLARFTKKQKWAHLDVAGTAWRSGGQKGSTGRPVPLLVQFLINRCTPGRTKSRRSR